MWRAFSNAWDRVRARWPRVVALAIKELQVVLLDRRARVVLFGSPVLQLALFGLATTLEVKNIDVGVVDRDNGRAAEQVLAAIDGSRQVRSVRYYASEAAARGGIDRREVIVVMELPADLSRRVAAGQTGRVGLVLDGRRINAAQIIAGYFSELVARTGATLRPESVEAAPQIVTRNWFNLNLDYRYFTMPSLIALVIGTVALNVAFQTFAREREMGTFDTLVVMPLQPIEVLVGKLVPATAVGIVNALIFIAVIPVVYGVPLQGSLALLLVAAVCFALALAALGLVVSLLAANQQQAFLFGFLLVMPIILLSGYAAPTDNMPQWLQIVSDADPLHHMLEISQGVFLKAMPWEEVLRHLWPMLACFALCMGVATILCRRRMR